MSKADYFFDKYVYKTARGYNHSSIFDVYKNPSTRKRAVWDRICMRHSFVAVLSATCQFFTVGYIDVVDGHAMFTADTGINEYTKVLDQHDLARVHLKLDENWRLTWLMQQ